MYNTYKEPKGRRRSVDHNDRVGSARLGWARLKNGSGLNNGDEGGRGGGGSHNDGVVTSHGMCDAEKKVLRRRKVNIAEHVEIDAEFLTAVRERQMIEDHDIPIILVSAQPYSSKC